MNPFSFFSFLRILLCFYYLSLIFVSPFSHSVLAASASFESIVSLLASWLSFLFLISCFSFSWAGYFTATYLDSTVRMFLPWATWWSSSTTSTLSTLISPTKAEPFGSGRTCRPQSTRRVLRVFRAILQYSSWPLYQAGIARLRARTATFSFLCSQCELKSELIPFPQQRVSYTRKPLTLQNVCEWSRLHAIICSWN